MKSNFLKYPELNASSIKTTSTLDPDDDLDEKQLAWEGKNKDYFAAKKALKLGETELDDLKKNVVFTVKKNVNNSRNNSQDLIPKGMFNYVKDTGGYGCQTTVCSVLRKAGAKLPTHIKNEKTGEFEPNKFVFNKKTYRGGDQYPVFSGNNTVDELLPNMGLSLTNRNTLPDQDADIIKKNFDNRKNTPAGFDPDRTRMVNGTYQRGSTHVTIATDTIPKNQQTGNNPVSTSYYNPGDITSGVRRSQDYNSPDQFDNTDQDNDGNFGVNRVLRLTGNVPYLKSEMKKADKARNYGSSPQLKSFIEERKKYKPATVSTGKITGNTQGLNSLLKKLKKK